MATITKESIGDLHDKLTVKVSKEDYYPSFEKAILYTGPNIINVMK